MPKSSLVPLLLAAALLSTGCFHARTLSGTRYDLEREIPGARFEPEFQITLGRGSLGLARAVVNRVEADGDGEADEGLTMLRSVRRVEVATYLTHGLPELEGSLRFPGDRSLKRKGWNSIVTTVDGDGATWVYMRPDAEQRPRDLMVVALDDDELVMVKVRGDLQRMMDQILEEDRVEVPGVVEADLEPEDGRPIAVVEMAD
ncbi:MAG: hypothetical protein AAGD06_06770 [Acidobacteriota bacterium]